MHGYRRGKPSEYGIRLREKQKLKRFYGLLERQFRRYFALASRSTENTGEQLLTIMERRLDNVVHRLGFAPNRASARQLVTPRPGRGQRPVLQHPEHVAAGRRHDPPSRTGRAPCSWSSSTCRRIRRRRPTTWNALGTEPPEGRVSRLPTAVDVDPRIQDIREQLIIEFCSR